jgi:hypothetical protein
LGAGSAAVVVTWRLSMARWLGLRPYPLEVAEQLDSAVADLRQATTELREQVEYLRGLADRR